MAGPWENYQTEESGPWSNYETPLPESKKVEPVATRSKSDEFLRQLGLSVRALVNGTTGGAQAIGDTLNFGTNKLFGTNLQPVSQTVNQGMQAAGIPEPETPLEKGVQFGSTMLAGAMDPTFVGASKYAKSLAPRGFTSAQRSAKGDVVEQLRKEGIKLTPAEMEAGPVARATQGLAGGPRMGQMNQHMNSERLSQMAAEELGMPSNTKITPEVLKNQADRLIQEGYTPLRNLRTPIQTGGTFHNRMLQLFQEYGGRGSLPPVAEEAGPLISRYLYDPRIGPGRFRQSFNASDAIDNIRQLREAARSDFKAGGTQAVMGQVRMGISRALEDAVEQNLRLNPRLAGRSDLLERFRAAREGLAKNFAVADMLVDDATGMVSTSKAFAQQQAGTPLTGKLRTIANAGSPLFKKSTDVPVQGNPAPISLVEGGVGTFGAGMSAAGAGPVGWGLAALPMARTGARHALLSEPMQNFMARGITGRSMLSPEMKQSMLMASPEAFYNSMLRP